MLTERRIGTVDPPSRDDWDCNSETSSCSEVSAADLSKTSCPPAPVDGARRLAPFCEVDDKRRARRVLARGSLFAVPCRAESRSSPARASSVIALPCVRPVTFRRHSAGTEVDVRSV
jgi:hypothetical protein